MYCVHSRELTPHFQIAIYTLRDTNVNVPLLFLRLGFYQCQKLTSLKNFIGNQLLQFHILFFLFLRFLHRCFNSSNAAFSLRFLCCSLRRRRSVLFFCSSANAAAARKCSRSSEPFARSAEFARSAARLLAAVLSPPSKDPMMFKDRWAICSIFCNLFLVYRSSCLLRSEVEITQNPARFLRSREGK